MICAKSAREPKRVRARLAYLETASPAQDQVAHGHANILVDDLAVPLRCVVIAKDLHGPDDLDSRSIRRYDDDTLLVVAIFVVGVALAEDKMDSTAGVASAADPPSKESEYRIEVVEGYTNHL